MSTGLVGAGEGRAQTRLSEEVPKRTELESLVSRLRALMIGQTVIQERIEATCGRLSALPKDAIVKKEQEKLEVTYTLDEFNWILDAMEKRQTEILTTLAALEELI